MTIIFVQRPECFGASLFYTLLSYLPILRRFISSFLFFIRIRLFFNREISWFSFLYTFPWVPLFSEFLICSSLVREIARGGLLTSVVGEKRGLIMCFWLFLGWCKKKQKQVAGFFQANRLITVYSNCKSSKLKMRDWKPKIGHLPASYPNSPILNR